MLFYTNGQTCSGQKVFHYTWIFKFFLTWRGAIPEHDGVRHNVYPRYPVHDLARHAYLECPVPIVLHLWLLTSMPRLGQWRAAATYPAEYMAINMTVGPQPQP